MAEQISGIERVQELRSRLEIFWRNVLGEYFEQHHEYPPFVDRGKVGEFIQLVSNRDSQFRQSVEQFRPIQSEVEKVAMEVYRDLIKAK
ncbi:MAG: hypothetical protein WC445_01505 [Patescibacteria group bacterium]